MLTFISFSNDFSVGGARRRHRISEFIIALQKLAMSTTGYLVSLAANYTPRAIPKESPFNVTPSGSITTSRLRDASTLPAITAVS